MEVDIIGKNADLVYYELLKQRRLGHIVDKDVEIVFCLLPFFGFSLERFQH